MQALFALILCASLYAAAVAQPEPLVQWSQIHGDSCWGLVDQLHSAQPTRDGGFILVGYTGRFVPGGNFQVLLMRTDSVGNLLWEQSYGGGNRADAGWEVVQTSDGGFVVGGQTSGDLMQGGNGCQVLWKVDSLGSLLWRRQDYGDSTGAAYAMAATSDGGFVLAGEETRGNPGNTDVCLTRTDSQGNLLWQRRYDAGGQETALAIVGTQDGGFLVTGYHFTADNDRLVLLVLRTDSAGNPLWQRLYPFAEEEGGKALLALPDDHFLVLSVINVTDTYNFLTKVNGSGDVLWRRPIATPDSVLALYSLAALPDGFALTGYTGEHFVDMLDLYLAKTDLQGQLLWHRTINFRSHDFGIRVLPQPDGSLVVAGTVECLGGITFYPPDVLLLRTGTDALPVAEPPLLQPQAFRLTASPNPFNPQTTLRFTLPQAGPVTLAVFDLTGRQVATLAQDVLPAGPHQLTFDGTGLPSGLYFARLSTSTHSAVQKLVLLK